MNPPSDHNHPVRIEFDLLKSIRGLEHGVFTRHGGVSEPPYATLNTAWNNGDSIEAVSENLERIRKAMGIDHLVSGLQVHGDTIPVVNDEVLSRARIHPPVRITPPGDALVTALSGIGIMTKIADCQAILLADPVRRVVANVHSGWRGSVVNIAGKTVEIMEERFGSRPGDIVAAISPSLGPCCAEFRNYLDELPPHFRRYQVKPLHFDFWRITRMQLMEAGLGPEHIEAAERCTVCGVRDFFSYRAEKVTGRMAAVIAWRRGGEDAI